MNANAPLTTTLLLVNGTLMAGIYALAKVAGDGGIELPDLRPAA